MGGARFERWLVALAMGCLVGCGGVSFQYGDGQARTVAGLQTAMVPGVVDARAGGAANPQPSRTEVPVQRELQQVQQGTAEHLRRAGLPQNNTIVAPRNAAEVEGILQAAAQRGLSEVWFVRYQAAGFGQACFSTAILAPFLGILPWIILDSLPINSHAGVGGFEVMAVDARSRQLLARYGALASHQEGVSAWGCGGEGLMREMLGRALQTALEGVEQQRLAGYPNRQSIRDLGTFVLTAPTAFQAGNLLYGPGWQFELPGRSTVSATLQGVTATAPGGIGFTVTAAPANASDSDNTTTSPDGSATQRMVVRDGYAVTLVCAIPGAAGNPTCARALSTLQVTSTGRN